MKTGNLQTEKEARIAEELARMWQHEANRATGEDTKQVFQRIADSYTRQASKLRRGL